MRDPRGLIVGVRVTLEVIEIGYDCFCALQLARVDGLPLQELLRFEELWRGQRALGQELTEPE